MLVCSNVSPAALGGIDRAADDFRELGERAAARGLRVGYEALAWGRHVYDHRDAWEIVRRADHPAVGLILDSFHTLARGIDPESIRRIPGDRIFLVQVADAPLLDMDLLSWSRHFRNMPGPRRARRRPPSSRPSRRPAMQAICRWKSSTTSSAPARRESGGGRRPALAHRRHGRRGQTPPGGGEPGAQRPAPRTRASRSASSSSSSRPTRRAPSELVRPVSKGSASQARPAHLEGCRMVAAGRHQPRHQLRAGGFCPRLLHHPRHRRLRARPARGGRGSRRGASPGAAGASRSSSRSAQASWRCRQSAASAAA